MGSFFWDQDGSLVFLPPSWRDVSGGSEGGDRVLLMLSSGHEGGRYPQYQHRFRATSVRRIVGDLFIVTYRAFLALWMFLVFWAFRW